MHSPRFYVPGLAGQLGMPLEQRRTLGHWGPNSNMPVVYDQARCCTELRMKAHLWESLAAGFQPVGDFHIPPKEQIEADAKAGQVVKVRQSIQVEKQQRSDEEPSMDHRVLINHRSWIIHKADPTDLTRSLCPYARKPGTHYEAASEVTENLHMYQKCMACFGKLGDRFIPTWQEMPERGQAKRRSSSSSASSSTFLTRSSSS